MKRIRAILSPLKRILCVVGHEYTRFEYYEDDSLANSWGYLHCDRCGEDGYKKLYENEYKLPS